MSASHVVDVPRRLRHAAPAPRRSPLISLLAFWMFLQGAVGGLIALLLVVGSGIAGADQSAGGFAPGAGASLAGVAFVGAFQLLVIFGLLRHTSEFH